MTIRRLICWIGIHVWALSLRDDERSCMVCGKCQYVATETDDGEKSWETWTP
jgi:hypothetical protein